MKKLILTALVAIAIGASSFAASTVNEKATSHFAKTFAAAKNVAWKSDLNYSKVAFVENGEQMEAFYSADGSLIATSKSYAFDKLPATALKIITKEYQYPSYSLKDCIEVTNEYGEKSYYVSMKNKSGDLVLQVSLSGDIDEFLG